MIDLIRSHAVEKVLLLLQRGERCNALSLRAGNGYAKKWIKDVNVRVFRIGNEYAATDQLMVAAAGLVALGKLQNATLTADLVEHGKEAEGTLKGAAVTAAKCELWRTVIAVI